MFDTFMKCLPSEYKDLVVYNFSKNMYSFKPLPFTTDTVNQNSISFNNQIKH